MYEYLIGKVTDIKDNHIILEVNHIGYLIIVNNPHNYSLHCEYQVFIEQIIREKEHLLYGFEKVIHKEMFLTFMNVKGVGPQIALNLAGKDINEISYALSSKNVNYFSSQKKIGQKLANQIIVELCTSFDNLFVDSTSKELELVLLGMGYSHLDISSYISNSSISGDLNQDVESFIYYSKNSNK